MKTEDYKMTQQEKDLYEILYKEHGSSLDITTVSKVVNKSPSTLYRMRQTNIGPGYIKDRTKSDNSAIRYPLHEVVRYICETNNIGAQYDQ
jgi:predicted transcriptional regulator